MKIVIDEASTFNLSPFGLKYYANLKGIEVFFYKEDIIWNDTNDVVKEENYVLMSDEEISNYNKRGRQDFYCFTKFMGNISPEKAEDEYWFTDWDIERNDPDLLKTIIDLGEMANGEYSKLRIIEIPDGVNWYIDWCEFKGEFVSEKHRTWN